MDETKVRALLEPHLSEGEGVEWVGRPQQGLIGHDGDRFTLPFAVMLVLMVTVMAIREGRAVLQPAEAIWTLLIGLGALYYALGRFIIAAVQRRGLGYAVTKRRAFVLSAKSVDSAELTALSAPGRAQAIGPNGPVTVLDFGEALRVAPAAGAKRGAPPKLQFELPNDQAELVRALATKLRRGSLAAAKASPAGGRRSGTKRKRK